MSPATNMEGLFPDSWASGLCEEDVNVNNDKVNMDEDGCGEDLSGNGDDQPPVTLFS